MNETLTKAEISEILNKSRYMREYLGLKCRPALRQMRLFPKIKEVTESLAALHAIGKLKIDRQRSDVLVISVGDGFTPRTGALAAMITKWTCISIDPGMAESYERFLKVKAIEEKVNRLKIIPFKVERDWANVKKRRSFLKNEIEETDLRELQGKFSEVVFLFVHSHASVGKTLRKFSFLKSKKHIVSMPCCFDDDIQLIPDHSYEDKHIASVKNRVNIYRDLGERVRVLMELV